MPVRRDRYAGFSNAMHARVDERPAHLPVESSDLHAEVGGDEGGEGASKTEG